MTSSASADITPSRGVAAIAPFVYTAQPARVLFGAGTLARVADEVDRLGLARVMVVATQPPPPALLAALGGRVAAVFAHAAMHTPVDVTDRAMAEVARTTVDGVVAIGGGSAIGLGKAIAWRTDLPQLVVPTTYAGSEMTAILGETRDGEKVTRTDPRILPETVVYDVDLTRSLPVALSVVSGLNAIAHAAEALYARDRNPIVSAIAVEGIGALAGALPAIIADPAGDEARAAALYGAWLCGTCLGAVGMAIHHKLCHTLGGSFGLPHAETHAVVLPHALAYTLPAVPDVARRLAETLGTDDPARCLYDLAASLGAPTSLAALGMPEAGIDAAADRALANPYWNPRPLERAAVRALIARAWSGAPPARRSLICHLKR